MYNLLIGGAAGQGIDTTAAILEKLLKRSGYYVYTVRDFMSRIRGGHNFSLLRFGPEPITSHSYKLDGIIAMNDESIELHLAELKDGGFILCDSKLSTDDPRAIKVPMDEMAKAIGNPRVAGSVAVGVLLKLFGEPLDYMEEVLRSFVKGAFIEVNVKAIAQGYEATAQRYSRQAGDFSGSMIVSGNRALALGAIAAGLKFYSAYPMSPSTTILEYLSAKSEQAGIVVEQAEDEIAAINMAIGASYAGARAMTGTSGGGFSLMVEALGLSGMAEIPLVVADIQRPGPVTGLPTRTEQSDLKFVISASQGEFPRMVVALRDHADAFYQTARAFALAEKYQIPVLILSDQYLGDASATVPPFNPDSIVERPVGDAATDGEYLRYRLTPDGISPRLLPGITTHLVSADSDEHDELGRITESAEVRNAMMDKRMGKLKLLEADLLEPEFIGVEGCATLLIGWGSTRGPIAEAVRIMNEAEPGSCGALCFGDVFPLPKKLLLEKAPKACEVIGVEQNATAQFAGLVRELTGIEFTRNILKYDGRQISGEEIAERARKGADR